MTLRDQIIATACAMNASGINQGRSGNISARACENDGFIITPSGIAYEALAPGDLVSMDWDGTWTSARSGRVPSSEWRMHRDILAARAEFGAVLHCHPVHCTALAVHGRGIGAFHYMVALAGGPDIRCAGYATFGSQALSDAVLVALEDRRACLMAHHGMITCGETPAAALDLAVEVETLAAQYLAALQLGEPPELSTWQMEEVLDKMRAGYGYGSTPATEDGNSEGKSHE